MIRVLTWDVGEYGLKSPFLPDEKKVSEQGSANSQVNDLTMGYVIV